MGYFKSFKMLLSYIYTRVKKIIRSVALQATVCIQGLPCNTRGEMFQNFRPKFTQINFTESWSTIYMERTLYIVWADLQQNRIPLNFFSRSKCYTFLESLGLGEKGKICLQFFFGLMCILQTIVESTQMKIKSLKTLLICTSLKRLFDGNQ